MLLWVRPGQRAPYLAVHVTVFPGAVSAHRWRRRAVGRCADTAGLVFAKAMPFVGTVASGGFDPAFPAAGAQVLLMAWQTADDFDRFLDARLLRSLDDLARYSGWWFFEVAATRGSHRGYAPLVGTGCDDGVFGALTLGRTTVGRLAAFTREGVRLGPYTRAAPGVVAAVSAGIPLTGNCTVSAWSSETDMHRFAYGDADGHAATVRRRPPILAEQLNARMRMRGSGGTWDPKLPFGALS